MTVYHIQLEKINGKNPFKNCLYLIFDTTYICMCTHTLAFAFSFTSFANSRNFAASSLLYGPGTDPYLALYA